MQQLCQSYEKTDETPLGLIVVGAWGFIVDETSSRFSIPRRSLSCLITEEVRWLFDIFVLDHCIKRCPSRGWLLLFGWECWMTNNVQLIGWHACIRKSVFCICKKFFMPTLRLIASSLSVVREDWWDPIGVDCCWGLTFHYGWIIKQVLDAKKVFIMLYYRSGEMIVWYLGAWSLYKMNNPHGDDCCLLVLYVVWEKWATHRITSLYQEELLLYV